MPKRIVVCSDGTGNTAIKDRGTNVFKVFEAVDLNGHRLDPTLTPQVALYDDGVGTEDFKPLKLIGGAFGWGLTRNVKALYKELARVYDPGDEIYMFGFSRGAFTVRTLAGLISTCGLVDPQKVEPKTFGSLEKAVDAAYAAYRRCYQPWLWQFVVAPTKDAGKKFKDVHSVLPDVPIRFLGVWDTVDAVGLPFHIADVWNAMAYRFKFPDHDLSSIVQRACQALSVDDPRQSFYPQLWNEKAGESRITQVWFAGVHSNVGGGYPKQGMSLVPLDWMLAEAERAGEPFNQPGLRVDQVERTYYHDHANVDDKLYDPRSGLGVFYRWRIRNIGKLCSEHKIVRPKVHLTALERIAHGTEDYSPGNLPANAEVVITRPTKGEDVELALRRAAGVQKVLEEIPNSTLLNQTRVPIEIGTAAYYVYLVTCGVALLVASGFSRQSLSHPLQALVGLGKFAFALMTALPSTAINVGLQLVRNPPNLALVLGGLAASYLMMRWAGHQMGAAFSGFWYQRQTTLRDALKQARAAAIAASPPGSVPGTNQ
jgi:hypothetical protein